MLLEKDGMAGYHRHVVFDVFFLCVLRSMLLDGACVCVYLYLFMTGSGEWLSDLKIYIYIAGLIQTVTMPPTSDTYKRPGAQSSLVSNR